LAISGSAAIEFPAFAAKPRDVVGCYHDRPARSLVPSVDDEVAA
jgi:hypothetical protein